MNENENTTEVPETSTPAPEVTVTDKGNGVMTADVEPIDPLKEPVEDEAKDTANAPANAPTEKANTPNEAEQLDSDIAKQTQADKDIKDDLANKGVNFDDLAKEYADNGSLSDDSLKALEKAGYPKSVVDAYLGGLQALNDRFVAQVQGFAGGAENFQHLQAFLKTQPAEVVNAYNETIEKGNLGQIHLMMDGLMAKMTQTYGTANPTVMGNGTAHNAPEGYTSMEQMTKDMADPRYQVDPKFTREVLQKIKTATIF